MNADTTPFAARTVAIIAAVGLIGFAAFLFLSAYAPDLRPGRNGGGHALSTSAIGFKGIVDLARSAGSDVELIRDETRLDIETPVIVTPGPETTPKALRELLKARGIRPTLIVLPKWFVRRLPTNPAWVEQAGMLPEDAVIASIKGVVPVTLRRNGDAQAIVADEMETAIAAPGGGAILARIGEDSLWVLADPDYLDNRALATRNGAERAADILRTISYAEGRYIAFDLTLNGFARQPNLLKLAFEPPFAAFTLCLVVAALLAGLSSAVRFGAPAREGRVVALGKRALAENTAALLRLARRPHRTGASYATLSRDAVARATGARMSGDALDRYIDSLGKGVPYSALARNAAGAQDEGELLTAAKALYRWKGTIL